MKNLFYFIVCFFAFLNPSFAADLPQISSAVTDEPDLLTPSEESMLTSDLEKIKNQTGVQMALLIIQTTDGIPIEDYSLQVAKSWNGGIKDRDDGILYVLAAGDRKMRLEFGSELEPVIPDAQVLQILDQVTSDLRSEKYFVAFTKMISHIEKKISFIKPGTPIDKPPPMLGKPVAIYWIVFFLGAYPMLYLVNFVASNRMGKKWKEKSKLPISVWLMAFFIIAPLLLLLRGESRFDQSSGTSILIYAVAHVFLTLLISLPILFFRRLYLGLTGQGWGAFGGGSSSRESAGNSRSGKDKSFGGGGASSSW